MAVGAILGVVLGYLVYASGQGADGGVSFGYWLSKPVRFAALWWGVVGAGIGAALVYVRRLL